MSLDLHWSPRAPMQFDRRPLQNKIHLLNTVTAQGHIVQQKQQNELQPLSADTSAR